MRIAVVGAGGTGGYFGGLLARAGQDVTFIARGTQLEALRTRGLTVESRLAGTFTVPVQVTDNPHEVNPVDLILFCVKTYDVDAAAEGRFLPFLADWVHAMAAAIWMGGLLGFVVALFSRPLGALAADRQAKLREHSVRRFSRVATTAVVILACTGLYAILLHVPSPQALVTTPYGRALLVKLGLLTFVLAIGAANFLLRGRGPFGRLVVFELLLALGLFVATGFLTSLPPASDV